MPLQHVQRYRAGFQHGVVEGTEIEPVAQRPGGLLTEFGDLHLPDLVGQRLPRRADVAVDLVDHVLAGLGRVVHEVLDRPLAAPALRSEEHTSELQSLMRISYAVFCLKKKKKNCVQHQSTPYNHKHNYLS